MTDFDAVRDGLTRLDEICRDVLRSCPTAHCNPHLNDEPVCKEGCPAWVVRGGYCLFGVTREEIRRLREAFR
jgi:hypothetical protein